MKKLTLKIKNMYCVSCAVSIDFALEDLGVKPMTNYTKAITEVFFDPKVIAEGQIIETIEELGYKTELDIKSHAHVPKKMDKNW